MVIRQLPTWISRRHPHSLRTVTLSVGGVAVSVALAAMTVRWGWSPLVFALGVILMVAALLNPFFIAIGLALAVALSPELPLGLPLRVEDFVLLWGIIVAGLRSAVHRTPWPKVLYWQPWMIVLTVEAIATLVGVIQGTARLDLTVYSGLIFLSKSAETFILYAVTIWSLDTTDKIKSYIWVLLLSGALLGTYGMAAQLAGRTSKAIMYIDYAPVVDVEGGGAYSLIALALIPPLALGVSLWLTSGRQGRRMSTWLLVPIVYSLTFSLSRQGYVGAVAALCTALWIRSRRSFILVISLILILLWLFPTIVPDVVRQRVSPMFDPITGGELGMASYRTRINAWRYRFPEMWRTNPITGRGLASLPPGFLDNQYLISLYYTGFLGLTALLWLLYSFGRHAWRLYRSALHTYPLGQALGLASLGAVIGLGVAGFGGSPFVAVRTREMFWLLMACMAAYSAHAGGEGNEEPLD